MPARPKLLHFAVSLPLFRLPLDKLDEILAAAQQTISASESPGPGGLASLGKHRPKGFFTTEVGSLVCGTGEPTRGLGGGKVEGRQRQLASLYPSLYKPFVIPLC